MNIRPVTFVASTHSLFSSLSCSLCLSLFLCVFHSAAAIAQSAPASQEPALARHSCAKPVLPDAAKKLTAQERNAVVASLETFRTCVRTFSDGQEKIKDAREKEAKALQESSQVALAAAKAAAAAVDTAVKDYNQYSEEAVKIVTVKNEPAPKQQGKAEIVPPRPARSY